VDLFPTICNLFGLEVDLRCFVGEDAFSQEGGVVYWRDSSVWDGKTYLDGTQTAALSPEQRELVSRAHAMLELSYQDRKRIHNLKYYTWVEQQGKTYEEINQQWYDEHYWTDMHEQAADLDKLINAFNEKTGVLAEL
jgi:hypothetical protein